METVTGTCDECGHARAGHGSYQCFTDGCTCRGSMSTFPCAECGGKRGHVTYCAVREQEGRSTDRYYRDLRRRHEEIQEGLRLGTIGTTVVDISMSSYSTVVKFSNGVTLTCKLTGQELDGHFDNSPQSLSTELKEAL